MSGIEIAGVITGVVAVWLTTRQNVWCWPVGIVSALLFVAVFFRARLYGAMGLQVVYVGLSVYGWYAWLGGGSATGPLRVTRTPRRVLVIAGLAGLAGTVVLGAWLAHGTDEALPATDAATTAFSLVAQWMQTRKWLGNWAVWLVVDLVYVGMNLSQGLVWTAGLYLVYTALAMAGWRDWRRSMEAA